MSFDSLEFQFSWREYQARVLDELSSHLDDGHLHIVAAPGSGKTILGLEVMRRLDKPSLVLAPSRTIRNQWIERLSLFGVEDPDWISTDIRRPAYLTVITYQALHAAFAGLEEDNETAANLEAARHQKASTHDVIKALNAQKLHSIILDEAHHLRKEWWKALTTLKQQMDNPTVISLTATPPYDVSQNEWQRYEALCGPVDAEISVPELVQCGDLCPHQDYVYFSLPTKDESQILATFKENIFNTLIPLKNDPDFLAIFYDHPWITRPLEQGEAIFEHTSFFSSMVIFLHAAGHTPPDSVCDMLGVSHKDIPPINERWLEVLLNGFIYHDGYVELAERHQPVLKKLEKTLRQSGAVERRKVTLHNVRKMKKMLAASTSKLHSICDIVRHESSHMKNNLRMVILADYIEKDFLGNVTPDNIPTKMGVVPIFEVLRQQSINHLTLGILTGSLVIIPHDAVAPFQAIIEADGVDQNDIRFTPLRSDASFAIVKAKARYSHLLVHWITTLFNRGHITTLIGTQSLLGEGWDAPSINSLILASYVGSFMLSNQMRGRAIRIDPDRPEKVANIWHLVAVDPETLEERIKRLYTDQNDRPQVTCPFDPIQQDLGHDMRILKRRFRTFEGLSITPPYHISNGMMRLGFSDIKRWNDGAIERLNRSSLSRAHAREDIGKQWQEALIGQSPKPEIRQETTSNYAPTFFASYDTLQHLAVQGMWWGGYGLVQTLSGGKGGWLALAIGCVVGSVLAAPKLLKSLYLWMRNGSLESSMQQVGYVVLDSLRHSGHIKTAPQQLRVKATQLQSAALCRLEGGTTIERTHFHNALAEILGPIENPRYILIRSSFVSRLVQTDYHGIPSVLAVNKASAAYFLKCWQRYVGNAELVYTRNSTGRHILLKARTKSLSSAFQRKTDRLSMWE